MKSLIYCAFWCAPLMAQNIVSVSPAPFTGGSVLLTFKTSAPAQFGDRYYFAFVQPGTNMVAQTQPANSCIIRVDWQPPYNSSATLAPDSGSADPFATTGVLAPLESGFYTTTQAIANSKCVVHSYVDGSGEAIQTDGTLQIKLFIDFNVATFPGDHYLYGGFRRQNGQGPFWVGPWIANGVVAKFRFALTASSINGNSFSLPAITNTQASVSFLNTTVTPRGGQNNYFLVGDSYHFDVEGPPGAAVVATRYQNGVQTSSLNLFLDGNGSWIYDGVVQASEQGAWVEQWVVGGIATPWLTFGVAPAGFTPTITYSLSPSGGNTGGGLGGGYQNFRVNDHVYHKLHGLPNGSCFRYGTYDGYGGIRSIFPAPQDVIWLDSAGNFSWDYSIAWWDAGFWVENWVCNGVPTYPAMVTGILP